MSRIGYNIPSADLTVSTSTPHIGDVAVMRYEKIDSSIMHYAYVEDVVELSFNSQLNTLFSAQNDWSLANKTKTITLVVISECNMFYLYQNGCGKRVITSEYKHLLGYYHP